MVCQNLTYFSVHGSSASGDIDLICNVTSQDHLLEWSYKFLSGRFSRYITTLANLVTFNILIVEMFLICHMTSLNHMFKGLYVILWVEVFHGKSHTLPGWWILVVCEWRYKIFNLSCDFPKPFHQRIM